MAVLENDVLVGPVTPAEGVSTISLDFDGTGWEASWLEVYKSGSETPLVLGTDYTVTDAGTVSAVVTLTSPANGTDAYSVYLATPLERSSDMQLRGEFKSEPFNAEMDRIWQRLQFHWTNISRSLRLGATSLTNGILSSLSPGQLVRLSDDGLSFVGVDYPISATFTSISAWFQERDAATALQAAASPDGTIVAMAALLYLVDSAATGVNSATNDLGVNGLVPFGDVYPEHCGAVVDNGSDTAPAITAAHRFIPNGGTLNFNNGTYRVASEITIPQREVNWVGTGRRMVYPGPNLSAEVNGPTTIYADHSNRNAVKFVHTSEQSTTFRAHGINVITNDSGANRPTAAFGFDCGGTAALFQRDFTFERCGIYNFTSAFDLYDSGSSNLLQMGVIKVFDCAINRNDWIARTLDSTNWNGFTFRDNEAGQQNVGGFDVQAHSFICNDNIMEGQPNPIKLIGAYRNIVIKGNYFEAVSGRACVDVQQCIGPMDIGPNLYIAVTADHKVILSGTGNALCHDPYWSEGVINTPMPMLGKSGAGDTERVLNNGLSTTDYGFYRTDKGDLAQFTKRPQVAAIATQRVTVNERELNPVTGNPMPVQSYTTSGAGAVALSYSIAGAVNDYVAMSWLMRQLPDASDTANPYLSMLVNGVAGNGGRDYSFVHGNHVIQGDWLLLTAAIKLTGAMTSLGLTLFPFGVSPAAGRVARFLRPVVYTTDNINHVAPYIDNWIAESVTATPGGGSWLQGDVLKNATPVGGNQSRFACTVAGTPGTWVYG